MDLNARGLGSNVRIAHEGVWSAHFWAMTKFDTLFYRMYDMAVR